MGEWSRRWRTDTRLRAHTYGHTYGRHPRARARVRVAMRPDPAMRCRDSPARSCVLPARVSTGSFLALTAFHFNHHYINSMFSLTNLPQDLAYVEATRVHSSRRVFGGRCRRVLTAIMTDDHRIPARTDRDETRESERHGEMDHGDESVVCLVLRAHAPKTRDVLL